MFFQNYLPEMETHIWQKNVFKNSMERFSKEHAFTRDWEATDGQSRGHGTWPRGHWWPVTRTWHVTERPLMVCHMDMARDREATDGQSRGHGTWPESRGYGTWPRGHWWPVTWTWHVTERPLMASNMDMARDQEATDGQSHGHDTWPRGHWWPVTWTWHVTKRPLMASHVDMARHDPQHSLTTCGD